MRERFALAEMAMRGGDLGRADEHLQILLRQDPGHLGALELHARIQWRQGRFADLVPTVKRLIALHPYEPGYHALMGAALQGLGRYGEATQAYERALGVPGSREALEDLNAWQSQLVRDLLALDPVFRARYRQVGTQACGERGLQVRSIAAEARVLSRSREERSGPRPRPS